MVGILVLLVALVLHASDIYCDAFSASNFGSISSGFQQSAVANGIRRKVHIEQIKKLLQSKDPRAIVKYIEDNIYHGKKGAFTDEDQEAVVQGMYSITKLQSPQLFEPLLQVWNAMTQSDGSGDLDSNRPSRAPVNPHWALRVLRLLTRSNRMADAERLCCSIGVDPPHPSIATKNSQRLKESNNSEHITSESASIKGAISSSVSLPQMNDGIQGSAQASGLTKLRALSDLAVGYSFNNSFHKACATLDMMAAEKGTIDLGISKLIMRKFLENSTLKKSVECMHRLISLNGLNDLESNQLFLGKVIRSFEFIKGAVSLDTMPQDDAVPEVAFMGRSNVGKSSLINLLSNRKKLAYTSKTPGKTSEYNFFEVQCRYFIDQGGKVDGKPNNGIDSGVKGARGSVGTGVSSSTGGTGTGISSKPSARQRLQTLDRLHLVDMPGVGYAEKSKVDIARWSDTLDEYLTGRAQLKCLFHLVDCRHGLLEADVERLSALQSLPKSVDYCIVLTKVDKSLGQGNLRAIVDKVRDTIASVSNGRDIPILLTSSVDKMGTLGVWAKIFSSIMNV
jgi:GTP-binding protein